MISFRTNLAPVQQSQPHVLEVRVYLSHTLVVPRNWNLSLISIGATWDWKGIPKVPRFTEFTLSGTKDTALSHLLSDRLFVNCHFPFTAITLSSVMSVCFSLTASMHHVAFDTIMLLYKSLQAAIDANFQFSTFDYSNPDLAKIMKNTITNNMWFGLTVFNSWRHTLYNCISSILRKGIVRLW